MTVREALSFCRGADERAALGGEDLDRRVRGQAVVEDDDLGHASLEIRQGQGLVDLTRTGIAEVDPIEGVLAQKPRFGPVPFETDVLRQPGRVEGVEEGRHALRARPSPNEQILRRLMGFERREELQRGFDEGHRGHSCALLPRSVLCATALGRLVRDGFVTRLLGLLRVRLGLLSHQQFSHSFSASTDRR
jgi:hypothetical protein